MINRLFLLLITIAVVVSCDRESSENSSVGKQQFLLDSIFSNMAEKGMFNGNVLIADKGSVIFEKSYGLTDHEARIKINRETVFELASVSKQFTAMGIVQLKRDNRLAYNDTIGKYIPELDFYTGVTIHDLLIHTGGLPDYMELADRYWDRSEIATNDDIINLFKQHRPEPVFKPGDRWEYSNTGYLILATIIERVSGKTFEEYLKEKIFLPLNMQNTFVYRRWYNPQEVTNYAKGYIFSDSLKREVVPSEDPNYQNTVYLDGIVGDGMVSSNVDDLLKWDQALYGTALIDKDDKRDIFSSYLLNNNTETRYGYGWGVYKSKHYGSISFHSGEWAGYETYIERHTDNKKTVIVLQNSSVSGGYIPIKHVRKIMYNQPIEKEVSVDADILKKYAGVYQNRKGREYNIILLNGTLMFDVNPELKLRLIPVSECKFLLDKATPETFFIFNNENDGEVKECRFIQAEKEIDNVLTRKD